MGVTAVCFSTNEDGRKVVLAEVDCDLIGLVTMTDPGNGVLQAMVSTDPALRMQDVFNPSVTGTFSILALGSNSPSLLLAVPVPAGEPVFVSANQAGTVLIYTAENTQQ